MTPQEFSFTVNSLSRFLSIFLKILDGFLRVPYIFELVLISSIRFHQKIIEKLDKKFKFGHVFWNNALSSFKIANYCQIFCNL